MASSFKAAIAALLAFSAGCKSCRGAKPPSTESWFGRGLTESDQSYSTRRNEGVPASLFARAMTSLPLEYRDDLDALDRHLLEEHQVFAAEAPDVPRAYLCCSEYIHGRAFKSALEEAVAPTGSHVRSALNHHEGYCAITHISSAMAAVVGSEVHTGARCSPLTHASKEPTHLLAPASATAGDSKDKVFFGLTFGTSLQGGTTRGLVVTMSPGSLPKGEESNAVGADKQTSDHASTRKGSSRKLDATTSTSKSTVSTKLEERWNTEWSAARGRAGADALFESISWTNSLRRKMGDGRNKRRLGLGNVASGRTGTESGKPTFHGAKTSGYKAALEHISSKMGTTIEGEQPGLAVSETCGWDNINFVHARNDVLYLREIHEDGHDEQTATACLVALVGFLSSQPEVMHIHPEAKIEATNKVLTAYVEGGGDTETPMRDMGLDGSGEVIGVSDTGLDDSSCFFKDENGMVARLKVAKCTGDSGVPQCTFAFLATAPPFIALKRISTTSMTTMEDAAFYPEQRKLVQYVMYADDMDGDGHGTHVAGIAAGAVYSEWKERWDVQVSTERCEDADLIRSCFGDCVSETVGPSCRWNPELSCPMSGCDEEQDCDDQTGYPFPCFDDPEDELPAAAGMAPGAKLSFFDIGLPDGNLILPDDLGEMWDSQHASGARIVTNSWSLVTATEPTERDIQLDEWVYSNPDSLVVFGAGNNGFSDGSFHPSSVQSPATAKSAITVGCSNSGPDRAYAYYSSGSSSYDGVMSPSESSVFEVSPFSARGPVMKFTAKPDIVAPGMMVHSAKASRSEYQEETCALDTYGGTSMSAPAIAGAAALIRQYFAQGKFAKYLENQGQCDESVYNEAGLCEAFEPMGYLVKAILVNSAVWLGNMQTVSYDGLVVWMTVLDFAQGFGAVQLASALPTDESKIGAFFHDNELAEQERFYYSVYISDPSEDFTMTVAWYDPPSTVASYNLIHDLDSYVMSMSTREYYRSNCHDTIMELCDVDEACANKYEFTYRTSLADYMNSVERIKISSENLKEGYYVIGIRARSLTESDTQAYGLAVAGGGAVLQDMSNNWNHLGIASQSATGGVGGTSDNPEPDPDNEFSPPETSSPTESPVTESASPTSTGENTAAPMAVNSFDGAEPAISWTQAPQHPSAPNTSDDNKEQNEDAVTGGSSSSATAYAAVGGDDPTDGESTGGNSGSNRDVVGSLDSDSPMESTIVIAASVAGAAALIAVATYIALRRRKGHGSSGSTNSEMCAHPFISRGAAARISDGDSVVTADDGHVATGLDDVASGYGHGNHLTSPAVKLPGYDTAVRMSQRQEETENAHIIRSASTSNGAGGADESGDAGFLDDATTEMSGFYAAVDPSAVSKLVEWGIGRDFARVALRQTENDIPAALRMVAKGDMDTRLALDLEEIARRVGPKVAEGATESEVATEAKEEPPNNQSD